MCLQEEVAFDAASLTNEDAPLNKSPSALRKQSLWPVLLHSHGQKRGWLQGWPASDLPTFFSGLLKELLLCHIREWLLGQQQAAQLAVASHLTERVVRLSHNLEWQKVHWCPLKWDNNACKTSKTHAKSGLMRKVQEMHAQAPYHKAIDRRGNEANMQGLAWSRL